MSGQFVGEIKILPFQWPPVDYTRCQGQTLQIQQYNALYALIGTIYGGDGRATFGLPDLQGRVAVGQGQGLGLPLWQVGQKTGAIAVQLTIANLPPHTHAAVVNQPTLSGGLTGSVTATGTATGTGNATGDISIPANNSAGGNPAPSNTRVLGTVQGGNTLYTGTANTTLEPFSVTLPTSVSVPISVSAPLNTGSVSIPPTGGNAISVVNGNTGSGSAFGITPPSLGLNYVIALNGLFPQRN